MIWLFFLSLAWADPSSVTVPLSTWQEIRVEPPAEDAPTIVHGSAHYVGKADPDTLAIELEMTLLMTLGGDGWKSVPVLSSEAVILETTVSGKPVPLSVRDGHHVWHTEKVGDQTLLVRALIPPTGGQGAIEYDFAVPQTQVTHLEVSLPRPELQPRVEGAVRTEVRTLGGQTRVTADLAPTDRIQILGLRDFGAAESRPPRVYAETLSLLSVDDERIEVFTEVNYRILYGGTRNFDVFVPEGLDLVSADGQGAFRYDLEPAKGGTLLRGETAFPIRSDFELSLRLQRSLASSRFEVVLPTAVGIERERGWLGVEVPGRVRLEEVGSSGMSEVSVQQLPVEMAGSAVSPILTAWRTSGAAQLELQATPLPAVELASDSIDGIHATTVVSASGSLLTDMRFTLRNRLRHALAFTLPEGARVVRANLDGRPVRPSVDANGTLLLPLRRSETPFVLQVVIADETAVARWFGWTQLALPSVDLPASTVEWDVRLPEGSTWSALRGDFRPQTLRGSGSWFGAARESARAPDSPQVAVPTGGISRHYARYWAPAGETISASTLGTAPQLVQGLVLSGLGVVFLLALPWLRRWAPELTARGHRIREDWRALPEDHPARKPSALLRGTAAAILGLMLAGLGWSLL